MQRRTDSRERGADMGTSSDIVNGRIGDLPRREVLRLAGAGGLALFLSSCSGGGSASSDSAVYPTGDVTLRWVQSNGPNQPFFTKWFDDYHAKHQNVSLKPDFLPQAQISQVISLGVQNRNAHDVWNMLPPNVSTGQAVRDGWIAPLDDVVPDFAKWKAAFPENVLVEGINIFNGKVYACPVVTPSYNTLLLYNRRFLNDAGYDPESTPLTWDDFRNAAAKITKAGNGKYYGWVLEGKQTPRLGVAVNNLAEMAGSGTTGYQDAPFNFHTGEFSCTTDEHIGAVELMLAMIKDRSLLPSATGMNADQAIATLPGQQAGMILQGAWNVDLWQKNNQDFDFGVANQPTPHEAIPIGEGPGPATQYYLYAGSKVKQVAGDMFAYLGSKDGQRDYSKIAKVATRPVFPDAFAGLDLTSHEQRVVKLQEQFVRVRPEPTVRKAQLESVASAWRGVTPDFGTTIQGILGGQLDARQGLQQSQDAYNSALDKAIAAARGKGADVSRDDFVFPNWQPTKNYTSQDYVGL
jgi:multiple sugar transport system substrate-binding protein